MLVRQRYGTRTLGYTVGEGQSCKLQVENLIWDLCTPQSPVGLSQPGGDYAGPPCRKFMQPGFRVSLEAVSVCAGEGEGQNMKKKKFQREELCKITRKAKHVRKVLREDQVRKRRGTASATQQPGGGSVTQFPFYCHLNTMNKSKLEEEKVDFSLYLTAHS